jgi:hypothetical protein
VLVRVNTRTDLLEKERSQGLISEAAYQAGREFQNAVERITQFGGSTGWMIGGDRIDPKTRSDNAVAYGFEHIKRLHSFLHRVDRAVGSTGTRLLRRALCDRVSYSSLAAEYKLTGERGVARIAAHCRLVLEELATSLAATGRRP